MRRRKNSSNRVDDQAAAWLAKLSGTNISTDEVERFRAWRLVPEHAAAYERLDRFMAESGRAADSPEVKEILAKRDARQGRLAERRKARRIGPLAGGLAGVAICSGIGLSLLQPWGAQTFVTGAAEHRTASLGDGSKVELGPDSRIVVRFRKDGREIDLSSGRALFDIAHDPGRPMVVKAADTVVRDLGTRFIVQNYPRAVSVILLSGSVSVARAGAPVTDRPLAPGETITLATIDHAPPAPLSAASQRWADGRLIFHDLPIADAIAEMNRYDLEPIVLDASAPRDVRINGAFEAGDARKFAAALASLYDLKADQGADGAVVLRRPENLPPSE